MNGEMDGALRIIFIYNNENRDYGFKRVNVHTNIIYDLLFIKIK